MTAKDGFYGRDNQDYREQLVPDSNEAYFLQINKETGDIEVWNEEFGSDKYVGVYKQDDDGGLTFEENQNWWGGARREEKEFFASDDGAKAVRKLAIKSVQKDLADPDITDPPKTPEEAQKDATELVDSQVMSAVDDPEVQAERAAQGLADLEERNRLLRESVSERGGTRSGAGSFGDFSYPIDRNKETLQDFMKFTLLEYKPKTQGSGSQFGFGDRTRIGPDGQAADRVILGSVSLPIPGGIRDENGCVWAEDSMNEIQIQAAGLARAATGASGKDPAAEAKAIADRIGNNNPQVKKAIQETFAGKAVGVQRLMTRSTGMIFNPNLELLFDKPTLRGFQFTFDLVPRSKREAEEVVKIIRFFKQGMSAIRSQSNLFLLSPNVFQIHYVRNANEEHPYIGKIKECAMTNFGVDYTPQQNYSTLTDGFMTAYRISMQLKELEPVFNDNYDQNGTSGGALPVEIGF